MVACLELGEVQTPRTEKRLDRQHTPIEAKLIALPRLG